MVMLASAFLFIIGVFSSVPSYLPLQCISVSIRIGKWTRSIKLWILVATSLILFYSHSSLVTGWLSGLLACCCLDSLTSPIYKGTEEDIRASNCPDSRKSPRDEEREEDKQESNCSQPGVRAEGTDQDKEETNCSDSHQSAIDKGIKASKQNHWCECEDILPPSNLFPDE